MPETNEGNRVVFGEPRPDGTSYVWVPSEYKKYRDPKKPLEDWYAMDRILVDTITGEPITDELPFWLRMVLMTGTGVATFLVAREATNWWKARR